MTFLPIVGRELRVASRKRSTHFVRMAAVLIAIIIGCCFGIGSRNSMPAYVLGKTLFIFLSVVSFIYSIAVGILITSDCLSVEKREGTLGLLFLTDLRGYDVVFGKLVATSLNAIYGMIAIFPVLAVPLLLGGVTLEEFWRVVLVCVNLMFFSLSAGIFASAISREDRKAMGLTILIIIGISAIPPLLGLYTYATHNWSNYPETFWIPSPIADCFVAFAKTMGASKDYYWWKLALTNVYGWVFIVLSCIIVPRSWHETSVRTKVTGWRSAVKWIAEGSKDARDALRSRLLDINAFLWLAGRGRGKTVTMWSVLGILMLAWLWCWGVFGNKDWLNEFNFITSTIILHGILKYFVATEACRRFVEDRRSGALELLLSTPITIKEILRGQTLALIRLFTAPVVTVVVIDLLFMIAGFNKQNTYQSSESIFWLVLYFVGITVFILDLVALSWVGMWRGMRSRGANRAALGTLARIVLLRWVVFALFLMFFGGTLFRNNNNNHEEYIVTFIWFGFAVGLNLFFMLPAKNKLLRQFRDIATQRFEFKAPKPAKAAATPPPVPANVG